MLKEKVWKKEFDNIDVMWTMMTNQIMNVARSIFGVSKVEVKHTRKVGGGVRRYKRLLV